LYLAAQLLSRGYSGVDRQMQRQKDKICIRQ
jgi:hypothetical protein